MKIFMFWSSFFHIYQPPDQDPFILERIVNESYRPLISGWLKNPTARITLNINACLTEMLFKQKYFEVINGLKILAEKGQLEFTTSAKFHPFLPILPKKEMERQIRLNEETNKKYFGRAYQPLGFFPPEMGVDKKVIEIVRGLGYKWIIMDEIAFKGKIEQVKNDRLYYLSLRVPHRSGAGRGNLFFPAWKISSSPASPGPRNDNIGVEESRRFFVFFRHRRLSNLIMSAMIRTPESLWEAVSPKDTSGVTPLSGGSPAVEETGSPMSYPTCKYNSTPDVEQLRTSGEYFLTAMDGETFGHHRPGLDKLLLSLYQDKHYQLKTVSELLSLINKKEEIDKIVPCTWATSEKEISEGKNFYLYYNPQNKLHRLQKRLMDLAIRSLSEHSENSENQEVRGSENQRTGKSDLSDTLIFRPSDLIKTPRGCAQHSPGVEESKQARLSLDRALSCNHMWWSNPDAFWSIEEIEKGAYNLKKVIIKLAIKLASHIRPTTAPKLYHAVGKKAEFLYRQILDTAFLWQRQGLPQRLHEEKEKFKKIPFKDRAQPGEYEALLEILKEEEQKAVQRDEYELAIRWRDSRYKLENGLDIYDFVHIIDQMRGGGKLGRYEELAKKYREEYKKWVPGQPDK